MARSKWIGGTREQRGGGSRLEWEGDGKEWEGGGRDSRWVTDARSLRQSLSMLLVCTARDANRAVMNTRGTAHVALATVAALRPHRPPAAAAFMFSAVPTPLLPLLPPLMQSLQAALNESRRKKGRLCLPLQLTCFSWSLLMALVGVRSCGGLRSPKETGEGGPLNKRMEGRNGGGLAYEGLFCWR